jgi:glycosyltransferase involved in cell wall biosynthesis
MLSCIVITRNEQHNIDRCLSSVKFCDEIIVVDSESSDNTVPLAKKYTQKIFTVPWKGYTEQRNHALQLATNDWVLSLDADEEIDEDLKEEILSTIKKSEKSSAFLIPRKTLHSGKWIKYGGWYPNYLTRLFKKSEGKWVGDEVHEKWETEGPVEKLSNPILHYSFTSFYDQVMRNNEYSSLLAKRLHNQNVKFSLWNLLVKPATKFFETYLFKLGFLDGYPGFIISISAAYSVFLKWAKLWELEKNKKAI